MCVSVVVQQQPEHAEQPNLPEVFDLVLSSSADARLLCKATAVSSYFRELAATSIRQRWPDLLVQTVKGVAEVSCTHWRRVCTSAASKSLAPWLNMHTAA